MRDELREELATLGQRLEMARWERREALASIRVLMREHGDELSLAQVARLTTVSRATLRAMAKDE